MGRYCFIEKCRTIKYKRQHEDNDTNLRFFGFPSNPVLREKWIEAIATQNKQESVRNVPKYSRICILHFTSDCVESIGYSQVRLKPNAVPSIFPRAQNQSLMQLSALSENLSNANVIDHCIPQLTKYRKVEHCMTAESNGQLLNTEMIAGQSVAVDEASMHSESMNDSQTSSITEKQAEAESSTFLCNVLSTRTRIYRYPGDIKDELIDQMTSASKSQCIRLLQSVCKAKDKKIKTLMLKKLRHTKKIVNLVKLLRELQQKCDLSENASEMIEV